MTGSSRSAGSVWLVGLATYMLAVFHRSSLAVAGLIAVDRFDISAAQLATFTMLQLLVYAGMQIPVGLLVDRFGPRAVLSVGAVLMVIAQTGFALADSYGQALAARALVGVADAMTFICVIRLVSAWFAPRRIPVVVQVTGVLGQLGSLAAAVPMTWALTQFGWTKTFAGAASVGLLLLVLVLVLVHDTPSARTERGRTLNLAHARSTLRESWAHPGTRLGFWSHFTSQFSATVMGLLWGFPFFVQGENKSDHTAGLLLSLMVLAVMVSGPLLGWRTAVRPWHRSTLVLASVWSIVGMWTVVLLWPGEAPTALLAVLVIALGVGGPASVIGFDFARTFNPPDRLASATGIVNQGGFIASLILVIAIGLILDLQAGGSATYTRDEFRWAMSAQYVLWAVGLVQIWRYRRRARARLRSDDPERWAESSGS